MDIDRSPLAQMRRRVSKTPLALASYDAFEGLLREKLVAWPKLSADRAAGFIMSLWMSKAVKAGRIRIPKSDLNWIVATGKLCRWKLKGAEAAWAKEIAADLLWISANTEAVDGPGVPAQAAAPD